LRQLRLPGDGRAAGALMTGNLIFLIGCIVGALFMRATTVRR
jgi:hypothetical protein